jgi:trimeric autotransporter adhesin
MMMGGGGPGGGRGGQGEMGGGPGGGRGGPDWQRGPNAMAFGNGRRNPQNSYQIGANFSLDNSALDARSFSVTGADVGKPAYASGRGGVMFGGPLRIPGLVSASKQILFNLNYEFQRNHTGTTSNPVNMPTAFERSGDFSTSAFTIYDPSTGSPFPNNVIPDNRISPTATALLNNFPNPNLPFATRNYQTSLNGLTKNQNLNSRVSNIKIGNNDRINGGVGYQQSNSITPNLFQFIDTGQGRGLNANVAWSHSFSRTLTNSLNYTFSRMTQESDPYFAGRENVAAELGIAGTSQQSSNWGPPNLSFTNYGSLTDGNYSLNRNQTSSVGDSLTWSHKAHNFSFGGDYRRQQLNQLSDSNGRGSYTFSGSATSLYVNGVAQTGTGYDVADFLLGRVTATSIRYGNPDKYFRGSMFDGYINDDWRIAPRFSLILGLRYEYQSPQSELYNRMVNLLVSPDWSSITAVTPGAIHGDRNNFSPRLGFAWRPATKGSLVVRGGYGLYYNSSVYSVIAGNMAQQPPFAQSLSATSTLANPISLTSGFLMASSAAGTSTYALDPNYRVGYAQSWNLTVQRDLPFSMFGTVGYLGTKGTRLDQQFIPNSVAPGAAESTLPHNYIYETSNGDSIYHAAQFQLNRRFHSGFMWRASYQLSKSIDNAGTGGRGQGNTPVAQNWLDLSAERGLSSFDNRHNLNLQLQYSSGMGTSGGTLLNGWKGRLLKDWTITNNFNIRSGNPFTATVGGNRSQVSGTAVSNTVRAEASGLAVEADGQLFNTAAFVSPVAGAWGNAGRNTIPGPTVFSMDSSLGRIFRFGERRNADLQIQSTNVLNHVTITSWGTVLGSSTYGLASNASAMRKVTVSLRFRF